MLRRNERCFCGSGKRYKHCHGALSVRRADDPIANWHQVPERVRQAFDRSQSERLRYHENVGFDRAPVIAGTAGDRIIVRGNELLHWKGRGGFLNFLEADLCRQMGETVLSDPKHPLHHWRKAMRHQAEARRDLGSLMSTVAVLNSLTVARDLFLVADNTNPRDRLLKSLRKPQEFHGARYELLIVACLIRGGFAFEFSDEDDLTKKHSDGIAHHLQTNRIYSVEMKAKGRDGVLGKQGAKPQLAEMKKDVSRLLREALAKPADHERLIFIDMNLPPAPTSSTEKVWWQSDAVAAVRAVEQQSGKMVEGTQGYVIFSNLPAFHMPLDEYYVGLETAFTAINRPDFAKDMAPLQRSFPDIAGLFKAFRNHDLVADEFGESTLSVR